jgi:cadmium resistance protein CadD (predicted permease)
VLCAPTNLLTFFSFSAVVMAIAAFTSTNLDDLFLLASLFVDTEFRTTSVVLGQYVGMSFLVVISILAALFTMAIPEEWISLCGLVPLLLGINRLWKLFKKKPGTGSANANRPDFVGKEQFWLRRTRSEAALVTLLTIANGGDNLSVYIPLFSIQRSFIPLYALVFGVMTALWCLLGYYLTNHRLFGSKVKKYGRLVIPFILIGIGLHVLSPTWMVFAEEMKEAFGYLHARHLPKNSSECRMSENPYRFSILRSTFSTGQESIINVTCPHSVQIIWS